MGHTPTKNVRRRRKAERSDTRSGLELLDAAYWADNDDLASLGMHDGNVARCLERHGLTGVQCNATVTRRHR